MTEGTVAADQLRLFVERIERLEEEKKGLSDDIRDVYAEAKANGYDTKIMRKIVALRKMETHVRQETDALLDTYREALGIGNSEYARRPRVAPASKPTPLESAIEDGSLVDKIADKLEEAGYEREPGTTTFTAPPLGTSVFDMDDERYRKAVELVQSAEIVSPVAVQEHLKVSYEAAHRYLMRMEDEGIVGPANALERREVLQKAAAA